MEYNILRERLNKYIMLIPLIGLLGILLFFSYLKKILEQNIDNLPLSISYLPPQWIFWVLISCLIIPFVLFNIDLKKRIISLAITIILICFLFLFTAPYGYPHGRDSQFALQVADNIKINDFLGVGDYTGFAITYAEYPAMYLFNVIASDISGYEITSSFMIMQSLLRLLLLPLIIYLIFRKFFDVENSILCVFLYFSCFTLINWPHHENFAIIFFFFFIYTYLIYLEKPTKFRWLLTIIASLFIFVSHHFTSYLLLTWICLFPLSNYLFCRYTKQKNRIAKKAITLAVLILMLFFLWSFYSSFNTDLKQTSNFVSMFSSSIERDLKSVMTESIYFNITNVTILVEGGELSPRELEDILISENSSALIKKEFSINSFIQEKKSQISEFSNKTSKSNFSIAQLVIIIISILILGFLEVYGLIFRFKQVIVNPFLLNNLIFSISILLVSGILLFTNMFYVALRIFEFAYIGVIPLISNSIFNLSKNNKLFKKICPILLILILLGGMMSLRITTIRDYYVLEDKIVESDDTFASPSLISASMWFKERFSGDKLLGDNLVYDTVGAFGKGDVRRYELKLLKNIFNKENIESESFKIALQKGISWIVTHKYSAYSYYKNNATQLSGIKEVDLDYNNQKIQFFRINDGNY